jgi:hypothetical protein
MPDILFSSVEAAAEFYALDLLEALRGTTAALIAAISLLERGGKKAAASDKMFAQMLSDYSRAVEVGRAAWAKATTTEGV